MRTWLHRFLSLALLIALGISLAAPVNALAQPLPKQEATVEVEAKLLQQFQEKGSAGYLIYFREKADLSPAYSMGWDERGQFVMQTLQDTAQRSQQDVREMLDKDGVKYQSFWIDNIILVEDSGMKIFQALQNRPEIESLKARRTMYVMDDALAATVDVAASANSPEAVEPNLVHVNADDVWGMGINGAGVVVSSIDTGVRYTHQALNSQYRGNLGGGSYEHNYNWFDPYGAYNYPFDGNSHGSHTMGTMLGDDGGANQIGMAPGAEWMACRGCDTSSCSDTALLTCAQFIAAPFDLSHANPDPSKRPNVVNNSWGDCGQSYDNWYQGSVDAWHAAGVYPVFSNGNSSNCGYSSPPGLNTVGNPARYGNVTGVGSTGQSNGLYATHSNWGPTDNPDTINPRGYPNLKPQVVAPGVNIRSAYNSGDTAYGGMTGTSMSAPHVVGLLALVWQAAPCLIGDYAATETLIEETAVPVPYATGGTPPPGPGNVPNYATGWGEIDALAAVTAALNVCGDSTLAGTVTSAGTPIEGAKVESTDGMHNAFDFTAADGTYSMSVFAGTHDVTASAYGYLPETVTGVVVPAGETVIQDFDLDPATAFTVSGVVADANTGWPLYAKITIDGFPGGPIFTDPVTGAYSISLVGGTAYTFNVQAVVPGYLADSAVVGPLSGNVTQDFDLDVNAATCIAPGYGYSGGVAETFDSGSTPVGWTVLDNSGGGPWAFNNPGNRTNLTGGTGGFAIVDSDYYGSSAPVQNTEMRTPVLNFSSQSSVLLEFKYDFNWYSGGLNEKCDVDVSTNGGSSWTNLISYSGADMNGAVALDVSSYAGGQPSVMFRWHYYDADWEYWWQVDDVKIGAQCLPSDGGLVVGNVYDNNTLLPLVGASVTNDASYATTTIATPDDPNVDDGFYTLFSPDGSHTFTASYPDYGSDTAVVNVPLFDTVEQDFYLASGHLTVSPPSLAATLGLNETETQQLTLTNDGDGDATWEIIEKDNGFVPGALKIPAYTGKTIVDTAPQSIGRDPNAPQAGKGEVAAWLAGVLEVAPAYADDLIWDELYYIPDITIPGTWNFVGSTVGSMFAADFLNGDFTTLYGVSYDNNNLYTVNTATGAGTLVGPTTPGTGTFSGLTGAPDGTLYGLATSCSSSELKTIDPATGATTTVGPLAGIGCGIDLAYNSADDMIYIVDLLTDSLFRVDPATAATTLVGSLNFAANYAQGLDYEEESGILYWAAYGSSGELRVIDMTTGASTSVGPFPGGTEVDALSFATGGLTDVLWLSEAPTSGVVPAGESVTVDVTFDSSVVTEYGDYLADLKIKTDTPYPDLVVPVTMTVIPDATFGTLEGTVTSPGYCDADPGPVEGALVTITNGTGTWTRTTDANGHYSIYLEEAGSPYTVDVAIAGYEAGSQSGVIIVGQQTTTVDFDLRLLAPCAIVDPTSFNIEVALGTSRTLPMDLMNAGAVELTFDIVENPVLRPMADIIQDGSFEDGTPNSYWNEYSLNYGTPLCDEAGCGTGGGTAGPRTGAWWAWFGGSSVYEEGSVDQDVIIPAGNATLSFYLWMGTTTNAADHLSVIIDSNVVWDVTAAEAGSYASYTLVSVDISAYADGASHNVMLYSETSSSGVTNFNVDDVVLDSQPFTDVDWLSEDPESGTVPADSSLTVDVTFTAFPTMTIGTTYEALMKINSNDTIGGQITVPVAMTVVELAYGVDVSPDDAQTGAPGESVVYDVMVTNTGTVVDTFDLALSGATYDTILSDAAVTLDPSESIAVQVTVQIPGDAADGDSDAVTITAVSQGDNTKIDSAVLTTSVVIPAVYGVDVSPDDAMTGLPGESVVYEVTITNIGDTEDSYDLALGASSYVSTLDMTSVGPLQPGESATVHVTVEIPAGAAMGDSDAVVVTATSQADPSKTDSATLTTTVGQTTFMIYLPAVFN